MLLHFRYGSVDFYPTQKYVTAINTFCRARYEQVDLSSLHLTTESAISNSEGI
jgi:hypothetical protein